MIQRSGAMLRNNQSLLLSTEIAALEIAESVLMKEAHMKAEGVKSCRMAMTQTQLLPLLKTVQYS